jgi:hypothetical protein
LEYAAAPRLGAAIFCKNISPCCRHRRCPSSGP